MQGNLKSRTISGMLWSFLQRFGTMGISFASNIILARLLTPDDYGCIGMLMIFIVVANTFIDGGFGSALIQKKELTQEDYSTVFYWNFVLSVFLYAILFLTAPLIAIFYDLPLLSSVLKVQGLVLIINALSIIQATQLRKQLKFKKIAWISLVSAGLSVAVTIILAWQGWGVWSLVAQQLLLSLFNCILFWIFVKWQPSWLFSLKSFKQLFGFGSFILLSNLINAFCNNIQGLLIGRFFSPATMGLYTQARKLEEVASTSFSSVVDQVSYPVLATVQSDKQMMISALRKLIMSLAYICFPMMTLLILIARPLIILLYSDIWMECIPYFQILCIAGIAICLQGINYSAVAAIGKSNSLFVWTIIKRGLALIILILGLLFFGIPGLLWGMVIGSWIIYIINARLVAEFIGYKFLHQFKDLFPILLFSIVSYGLTSWMFSHFNAGYSYSGGILQTISFVCLYLILSVIFKIEAFVLFKIIAFDVIAKFRK